MPDDPMDQLQDFVQQFSGLAQERRTQIAAVQAKAQAVITALVLTWETTDKVVQPLEEILGVMRHASPANQASVAEQIMGRLARCSEWTEHLLRDEQQVSDQFAILVTELAQLDLCERPFPGGPHLFTQLTAVLRPLAKKLAEPDLDVTAVVQELQMLIAQLQQA